MKRIVNIFGLIGSYKTSPYLFNKRKSNYDEFYLLIKENDHLRSIMEKPSILDRLVKIVDSVENICCNSTPNTFLNLSDFLLSKPIEFVLKPSIVKTWKRNAIISIKKNLRHYIQGFQLFLKDVQVSMKVLRKVITGRSISRREQKQLFRTISDLFRIVPMSIMIMIPALEFLIPVIVKFYPNFLPSQFIAKDEIQQRKTLQAKIELAKFLSTTVVLMTQNQDNSGLPQFIEKLREGQEIDAEELSTYSQMFRDELTLDHLDTTQLVAMCKFMDITPLGNDAMLRFQIRNHFRKIKKDDKLIYWEGVKSLSTNELILANKDRGMRIGVEEKVLRQQLQNWLNLSLEKNIPSSLLILSRIMTFHDGDKKKKTVKKEASEKPFLPHRETKKSGTDDDSSKEYSQLQEFLSSLPDTLVNSVASVVENKSSKEKLDEIYEEEIKIQEEKENLEKILSHIDDDKQNYYMRKFLIGQIEAAEKQTKRESEELEDLIHHLDIGMETANIQEGNKTYVKRMNKKLLNLMVDIYGDIKDLKELDEEILVEVVEEKCEKAFEDFDPGTSIGELQELFLSNAPDAGKEELIKKFMEDASIADYDVLADIYEELQESGEISDDL